MWSLQITYMTPIRRASSAGSPVGPVAKIVFRNRVALARSAAFAAFSDQSKARPSLCSETDPPLQDPEIRP